MAESLWVLPFGADAAGMSVATETFLLLHDNDGFRSSAQPERYS